MQESRIQEVRFRSGCECSWLQVKACDSLLSFEGGVGVDGKTNLQARRSKDKRS